MLTVRDLTVRTPDRMLLDSISFVVNRHDRVGIVGPNGAGKTTLLSILAGLHAPNAGSVSILAGIEVGYLRQGVAGRADGRLRDLLDDHLSGLLESHHMLQAASEALGRDTSPIPLEIYESTADAFERRGGYELCARLEESLHAFGVGKIDGDRLLTSLSGGEKTRASLAALIAVDPDLLLLDEPTNHLDRAGIDWLETFLLARQKPTIFVAHDRSLLDNVANRLLVIEPETASVRDVRGGYSDFAALREHEAAEHAAAYHRQQELITRIESDVRRVSGTASSYEALSVNDYQRGRARKIARTAVVRKRKLERLLASEDRIERPERQWGLAVSFGAAPESGNLLLNIEAGTIEIGGRPLLAGIDLAINSHDRLGLVGANGAGKTTLLSTIAGQIGIATGSMYRSPGLQIGWYSQEHEGVDLDRTPLEQARAIKVGTDGEVRAFLHQYLLGPEHVLRPAGELSYGERARVALALLAIGGANLLLLDEPMNHLDITAREELEQAIDAASVAMVMSSHDRYSLDRLGVELIDVERWRVR
jgi:ATP-binding cassette subfamily F protein 3